MYNKIFVSNRAGVGDVILTTPILKAIKDKFPQSHLTFMTGPNCAELVNGLSFIDEVVLYNNKSKQNSSMFNIIKKIWRSDIALLIDFKYRSAVIAFLAGIPIRAGLNHKRSLFMTHTAPLKEGREHNYEPYNYADIIRDSTGIDLLGDFSKLYVPKRSPEDVNFVTKLLASKGIMGDKPIVTIAPFTAWSMKNWPTHRYIELIKKIKASYDCDIVLTGDDTHDYPGGSELRQLSSIANLSGKTSLLQVTEIIARSKLLIGSCSGTIHMAAATNTPAVIIYGPTSPERWAPRKNVIILSKNTICSPCDGPAIGCPENQCIQSISVDEVFEASSKFLS
ncbi:MAG: rfaF 2 [Firmicutes bacterium]|nr:rfaF 2 [Bacillota bacterium]